jgi:DNA-binding response OmpR family regulator
VKPHAAPLGLVLVVEDDPWAYDSLEHLLLHLGYRTLGARTLEAARESLLTQRPLPDVVLIDLCLPDGSGLSLVEELSATPGSMHFAVITGAEEKALVDHARRVCPGAVFKKPLEIPGLFAWMRELRVAKRASA